MPLQTGRVHKMHDSFVDVLEDAGGRVPAQGLALPRRARSVPERDLWPGRLGRAPRKQGFLVPDRLSGAPRIGRCLSGEKPGWWDWLQLLDVDA